MKKRTLRTIVVNAKNNKQLINDEIHFDIIYKVKKRVSDKAPTTKDMLKEILATLKEHATRLSKIEITLIEYGKRLSKLENSRQIT
jgi:hypothetical protein